MQNMSEELSSILEADLNWREAELASFKIAIATTDHGSVREHALLRGAWALLYSHYEGFCKFAWDSYLDEIEKNCLVRAKCIDNIASLSLRKAFKALRGNMSDTALWGFFKNDFASLLSEPATFEEKLETDSNLWPNLYTKNAETLGIRPTSIDAYSTHIKTLVSRRNGIAHGEKMTVKDIGEYSEYENAALLVMHDLALCLIEEIENAGYVKVI